MHKTKNWDLKKSNEMAIPLATLTNIKTKMTQITNITK
jgi:hypothetical protein